MNSDFSDEEFSHEAKDLTVLWQGEFEGGTLILFVSKKYESVLFWKIFDPGFSEPLTGNFFFVAGPAFEINKFIDNTLETIKKLYLIYQQELKDERISTGTRLQ